MGGSERDGSVGKALAHKYEDQTVHIIKSQPGWYEPGSQH